MQKEALQKSIAEAFASVPHPGSAGLLSGSHPGCQDCQSIDQDFKQVAWQETPPELIDLHFDKLPLFSPQAYQHFLPAYMTRALETPGSMVWEFTFYNLSSNPKDLSKGVELFNRAQVQTVIDYLSYVAAEFKSLNRWLETDRNLQKRFSWWQERLKCR